MKMNDAGNIFTQFFAWLAAGAAALGLATQDLVFMFFGAAGLVISLASYVSGRIDARRKRKEDEKRTEMVRNYLAGAKDKSQSDRPAAVQPVVDALHKAGE